MGDLKSNKIAACSSPCTPSCTHYWPMRDFPPEGPRRVKVSDNIYGLSFFIMCAVNPPQNPRRHDMWNKVETSTCVANQIPKVEASRKMIVINVVVYNTDHLRHLNFHEVYVSLNPSDAWVWLVSAPWRDCNGWLTMRRESRDLASAFAR